jgi:hypothetical protein
MFMRTPALCRGVSYDVATAKWWAHLANGAHIRQLGAFDSEEEAALAHDAEATRVHGTAALTNFPQRGMPHPAMLAPENALAHAHSHTHTYTHTHTHAHPYAGTKRRARRRERDGGEREGGERITCVPVADGLPTL